MTETQELAAALAYEPDGPRKPSRAEIMLDAAEKELREVLERAAPFLVVEPLQRRRDLCEQRLVCEREARHGEIAVFGKAFT